MLYTVRWKDETCDKQFELQGELSSCVATFSILKSVDSIVFVEIIGLPECFYERGGLSGADFQLLKRGFPWETEK